MKELIPLLGISLSLWSRDGTAGGGDNDDDGDDEEDARGEMEIPVNCYLWVLLLNASYIPFTFYLNRWSHNVIPKNLEGFQSNIVTGQLIWDLDRKFNYMYKHKQLEKRYLPEFFENFTS